MLRSIGTDTEAFVSRDSEIYALHPGDIEGSKASPYIIEDENDIGIQLDNVLAEITFRPAYGGNEFEMLCDMAKHEAKKYLNSKGFTPVYKSHHIFSLPELDFAHAKVAGCEPDYPAIEGELAPVFDQDAFTRLRTGSGHLHFGLSKEVSKSDVIQYVRGLDRAIGAPLCVLHNDPMRRRLYGQAGRFRFKPYGFEYRTPDNYWFDQSAVLASDIWDVAKEMFSIPLDDDIWGRVNYSHRELADTINLGQIPEMENILNAFDFPQLEVSI